MTMTFIAFLMMAQFLTFVGMIFLWRRTRIAAQPSGPAAALADDSALMEMVETLIASMEERTQTAIAELERQRAQISSILQQERPSEIRRATRRVRRGTGAIATHRAQAMDLANRGYSQHEIARELRTSVEEVRLLLATTA